MFEQSVSVPISMEIYEHIIKDLQEHSQKNEEVYHLQISTLKEQLKEKNELIGEMSRRMGEITSRTHSELDAAEFEEVDYSMSNFTVSKPDYVGGSLPGEPSISHSIPRNLSQAGEEAEAQTSRVCNIEQETRCLKQQLNELFRAKQAQGLELNNIIDELKGQLVDYQTEKISLCDANHNLASENTRILCQLQQVTTACNHIRQIADQQHRELDELSHAYHEKAGQAQTLAEQLQSLNQQLKESEHLNQQLSQTMKEQQQTLAGTLDEQIQARERLSLQLQALRKEKQTKKDHSEKQHRLIMQYEKKNEESVKEIRRLEGEIASLHVELEQLKLHNGKLESEAKRLADGYEHNFEELSKSNARKFKSLSQRFQEVARVLTEELREQLVTLRQEASSWPQWISEVALQATSVIQARNYTSVATHSNVSLFNREEMLEFEVEELRKELLTAKKENFELKYENKKLQDRRTTAHEKQKELRAEIDRLNAMVRRQEPSPEKLETEQNLPRPQPFRLSDIGNRTAAPQTKSVTSRNHKQSRNLSRKESTNDQRIIQQITEMRKRIKNVREECLTKTLK